MNETEIIESIDDELDDIPELTVSQIKYIRDLQKQCKALVSDPESEFYEPDVDKRRAASRALMRKMEYERAKKRCQSC